MQYCLHEIIRLAVHLQHLSNPPTFIDNSNETSPLLWRGSDTIADKRYHEPVHRKKFSHICTIPIKYDPQWSTAKNGTTAFIVTGAQFHVATHDSTSVLHLRLLFSEVRGCVVGQSKWERGIKGISEKSSFFSFTSGSTAVRERERQGPTIIVDSGVFPTGPPVPVHEQKLLRFVDTTQKCKGPQDSPGYWVVTGAKLDLEKGKIGLHVKFSLLILVS